MNKHLNHYRISSLGLSNQNTLFTNEVRFDINDDASALNKQRNIKNEKAIIYF